MENSLTYDNEFGYIKIYSSVSIESTDIIRATRIFHGNEWFSDVVVVSSEETMWYGKVYFNFYCYKIQFFLQVI